MLVTSSDLEITNTFYYVNSFSPVLECSSYTTPGISFVMTSRCVVGILVILISFMAWIQSMYFLRHVINVIR